MIGGVPWRWGPCVASGLLHALAFNLTFFVQELFLVVPKALTPGLRPTLFHNNHTWEGDNPLAALFQGTGVLAILVSGLLCATAVRRAHHRPAIALLLIWMAFNGAFQALPQIVIGAMHPGSDVGMAFGYLELGTAARVILAGAALAAMPFVGLWVARQVLALLDATTPHAAAIARIVTIPACLAIALIVAFRVPRELVEVLAPPIVVTVVGTGCVQAVSRHVRHVVHRGGFSSISPTGPAIALAVLWLFFHLVLRPGIQFQ